MEPEVVLVVHHVQAPDSGHWTQRDVKELMLLPAVMSEDDFIKRAATLPVY
jgi:hypothetical protein